MTSESSGEESEKAYIIASQALNYCSHVRLM